MTVTSFNSSAAPWADGSPRPGHPLVAIVGRPNVGKSTLFNRLVGRQLAIVADQPGTTRDRLAAQVTLGSRTFLLVDTGGLEIRPSSTLWEKVKAQVQVAIAEADVILFVTDTLQGVTPGDEDVAHLLRQSGKPVLLVANKADNPRREMLATDLYQLGLAEPIPLSAYHNTGIDDLLVELLDRLPPQPEEPPGQEEVLHLAIVGRTNVGKSMLLNGILGQERAIVSDTPGTTRDALDTPFLYESHPMVLIDTAGIRRRGRIQPGVEKYSVLRAVRAIDRADVVLLVLDASELITAQDTHIAGQIANSFKGIVITVNKWDLAGELGLDATEVQHQVSSRLKFQPYAPLCFVSALHREGIPDIMDKALAVYRERRREVSQEELQTAVNRALTHHPPPPRGQRALHIRRVAREGTSPPTFTFYVNDPEMVHFSYRRYLENSLRKALGFRVTPLRLIFKKSTRGKG